MLPYFSYIIPIQVFPLTRKFLFSKLFNMCYISSFALMVTLQKEWKMEDLFLESNEEERGNMSRVTAKKISLLHLGMHLRQCL